MKEIVLDKIVIIYNPDIEGAREVGELVLKEARNSELYTISEMPENATFVVVIGGDGTLLKCARFYCKFDTPIIGFNLGRLGYLSQGHPEEIQFVANKIRNKEYRIEKRLMLNSPETKSVALNDMVIKGAQFSRTSTLELYVNETKLCSYMADGLIIATPTGSTAYALSAGGPIIAPEIECFTIVPICPHTLNARPIVIPSKEKIMIKTLNSPKNFQLTSDGQQACIIKDKVHIEKHSKYAKLVLLNYKEREFYSVLREKLHWSLAPNK